MSIIARMWKNKDSRPALSFSRGQLPHFVKRSPVARRFYALLHGIDWERFPERQNQAHWNATATPYRAFVAAYLLKLEEQFVSMAQLRRYLCEHPELVWLFGFTTQRRFDADEVLPTARHLTRLLRKMPAACATFLLDESVRLLHAQLSPYVPDFGHAISLDTKHILAWVKENNPKAYVEDRYNKEKQPNGDKDCRLGCKRRHNVSPETPQRNPLPASAAKPGIGEFHWGYASGVVATKVPGWGEFVLAEYTQPFDRSDVSYFFPLMQATERRLGARPRFGAFDAAFDAYYVYEHFHRDGVDWRAGFAAVPFSSRNPRRKTFDADGHPHCEAGLPMRLKYTFTCRTTLVEHERAHYICPLSASDQTCPIRHVRWVKGGCTHRIPTSPGARVRHQIDRESDLYAAIYKQRTATERINAQAVALGIERPYLRNQAAITNQNTLIYVLINLRALQRIQTVL